MDRTKSNNSLKKVVFAGTLGTILEWYDFGIYGTAAALVFNEIFFPKTVPWIGTLLSFAIFGVGFLARPFGGMFFGYIGDKFGRKPALMSTIIMMGIATTLIGLLPTYSTIGMWAPLLLVILRLIQGFGAGAEYAGALVYTIESTDKNRGFFGSFPSVSVPASIFLYSGVFSLVSSMPKDEFMSWGWRIPFLLSILTAAVGLYIRSGISETNHFNENTRKDNANPILMVFKKKPKEVILAALVQFQGVHTYTIQAFVLTYIVGSLKLSKSFSSTALLIAAFFGIFVLLISGAIGDKKGLRRVGLFGSVISGLFAFPMFVLIKTGQPFLIVLAMVIGLGCAYVMWGPISALLPQLFPVEFRYTGLVIGREFGNAIIGGTAPFVATLLLGWSGGSPWPVAGYMVVASLICFTSTFLMKDDKAVNSEVNLNTNNLEKLNM